MEIIILLLAGGFILLFGAVVFFGAPYLPTLSPQKNAVLKLLDLKPGQTLLELGSGDGRILLAAAQQGINSIGYELNPLLVLYSYIHTRRYRKKVRIIWGNYWHYSWPAADGIYVFLLDKYMQRLDKKIIRECNQPTKLVSFAFRIPGRVPIKKTKGLFLYEYR